MQLAIPRFCAKVSVQSNYSLCSDETILWHQECLTVCRGVRAVFQYKSTIHKGGVMNQVKALVVAVAVCGLLAGGLSSVAVAGENGHVKEVIKHVKESIAHEKEAITHMEEAVKGSDNAHAKEALEHAKESMKHAEESLAHAEQATHKAKGKAK
jgi:hypothetical protein